MNIEENQATRHFITVHAHDDVRQLALHASRYPDVDMKYALVQIEGRQKADSKLPTLSAVDGIIYPLHLSMEQCSSEQTARYKAGIAVRLVVERYAMVDLTGGFGIDCYYIGREFRRAVYVEQQQALCDAVQHNYAMLGFDSAEVVCGDGIDYFKDMDHTNLIYIDPARRDSHGGRTVAIADCTPDVTLLEGSLVTQSDVVMVKLSPMLDWHQVVNELPHTVEIHIVSVSNECKEMIAVLRGDADGAVDVCCCNDNDVFRFRSGDEKLLPPTAVLADAAYLYEPNASLMKGGCFGVLAQRFRLWSVAANSHLLVSNVLVDDFPGRRFRIQSVFLPSKREISAHLRDISQANIAVRNFPLTVAELRRKLKLRDGGDVYLFATTLADGSLRLLRCVKC